MKIYFDKSANKINKRWFRRTVDNIILHLGKLPDHKKWVIKVYGLESTDPSFFNHITTTSGQKINPTMPSGVTGQYEIKYFLHNSDNWLKEMENGDRIQHELCHARLFGTTHFVSGVHNTVRRFRISYWYWNNLFYKKTYISIIDIRHLL